MQCVRLNPFFKLAGTFLSIVNVSLVIMNAGMQVSLVETLNALSDSHSGLLGADTCHFGIVGSTLAWEHRELRFYPWYQ